MTARPREQLADYEFRMTRDAAEQAPCPRCRAGPGETCRNTDTGDELRAPAHPQRIRAADQLEDHP